MPTYFSNVDYGSRPVLRAGLGSLRSARATRRRRRLLGQDETDFQNYLPLDILSPGPIAVAPAGSIDVTEPAVPGTLVDPYTQQPLTAAQQAGIQPVVPITGIPGKPGVTYTASSPSSAVSASSISSFFSKPNSVLGISNGTLLIGAGLIAVLAAAGGKR